MRKAMTGIIVGLGAAVSSFALSPAVMAQDRMEDAAPEYGPSAEEMDAAMAMLGGLFAAEPLTAEQETRLPAANGIARAMMPDGFYGEMMGDMMDTVMGGMFAEIASAEMVIMSRSGAEMAAVDALSDEAKAEIAAILDPAYQERPAAMVEAMTDALRKMGAAMEEPMRDGYARAFAQRFDDRQLTDIAAFFSTPTGGQFAAESMALFADPQVMSSMMGTMPAMMESFQDMDTMMADAMATLPPEPAFSDLTTDQRARVMAALELDADELKAAMAPAQLDVPE